MANEQHTEVWRPVVGYGGAYEVSNIGRVRSVGVRWPGKVNYLSAKSVTSRGYPCVTLYRTDTGARRTATVHALVAEAFISEKRPGLVVNHKNGIKTDNRVDNLEWVTAAENNLHSIRTLGNPPPPSRAILSIDTVKDLKRRHRNGEQILLIARDMGINPSTAYGITGGYNWKDVE